METVEIVVIGVLLVVFVAVFYLKHAVILPRKRGWKTGMSGRDKVFYSEIIDGQWKTIEISSTQVTGETAMLVIDFPDETAWQEMPDWIQGKRDEVLTKMKTVMKPPTFEFDA